MTTTEMPPGVVLDPPEPISDDPDAPFGYDDDGNPKAPYGMTRENKPKRSPAGRPRTAKEQRSTRARAKGGAAMPGPQKVRPTATRTPKTPDYRPGLRGLLQMVTVPLAFTSPLDAAAVVLHTEPLVDAIQQTAQEQPAVANLIDKITKMGPYGLVVNAVLGLGAQIAANHGWLPEAVTSKLGALTPAQLSREIGVDLVNHVEQTAAGQTFDEPFPGFPVQQGQPA